MNKHNYWVLALAANLTACGGSAPSTNTETASEAGAAAPSIESRTCESIRSDVIHIAAGNGVNIVKIYDPKVVKSEPKKISCSGRALVSSGQEATLYYRDSQDADGDWLVQYAETPLD
jgi:hypothetical protein